MKHKNKANEAITQPNINPMTNKKRKEPIQTRGSADQQFISEIVASVAMYTRRSMSERVRRALQEKRLRSKQ